MRTEFTRPVCPKAHGYMELRAVEKRIYADGAVEPIAVWMCPTCGLRQHLPATEVDEAAQVCDFCSAPNPIRIYNCQTFGYVVAAMDGARVVKSQPVLAEGEWLACAECVPFIDADDRAGLTARVMGRFLGPRTVGADVRRAMEDTFRQLHEQFLAHRIPERR